MMVHWCTEAGDHHMAMSQPLCKGKEHAFNFHRTNMGGYELLLAIPATLHILLVQNTGILRSLVW